MAGEHALDVGRRDVLAAPPDAVVEAVDEGQVALGVEPDRVAGVEPEVAVGGERRIGHAHVAERRRPRQARADDQLADLPLGHLLVVLVDDAHVVEVVGDPAGRDVGPLVDDPVRDHADLGAAVGGDDPLEPEAAAEGPRGPGRARHRPGRPQRVVGVVGTLRLREHEAEHDAEERRVRRPGRPDPLEPGAGGEAALDPQARPDEQRAVEAHLGVDVEQRQLGQVHVAGAEVEELAVALGEQVQRRVREQGPLRAARGARGEVDRRRIGRAGSRARRRGLGGEQLRQARHAHPGPEVDRVADDDDRPQARQRPERGGDRIEQLVLDDQRRRLARVHEVLEKRPAVVDVHRHLDPAGLTHAEHRERELGAVAQHHEHALAAGDSEPAEAAGDRPGRLGGGTVGDLAAVQREGEERRVAELLAAAGDEPGEAPVGAVRDDEAHASLWSIAVSSR